jgi:hypothetical protein
MPPGHAGKLLGGKKKANQTTSGKSKRTPEIKGLLAIIRPTKKELTMCESRSRKANLHLRR